LKPYYQQELTAYRNAFDKGHFKLSWRHLERAHILSQPYPVEHIAVHWKMLRFGLKVKNFKEVLGQIPRLLLGGVKSFVGHPVRYWNWLLMARLVTPMGIPTAYQVPDCVNAFPACGRSYQLH
jgi:hypothetical protein